jgi:hypothetical protein
VGIGGIGLDGRLLFESGMDMCRVDRRSLRVGGLIYFAWRLRGFGGGGWRVREDAGAALPFNYTPKFALIIYSVEQSPSSEANRFVASQEIPRILIWYI